MIRFNPKLAYGGQCLYFLAGLALRIQRLGIEPMRLKVSGFPIRLPLGCLFLAYGSLAQFIPLRAWTDPVSSSSINESQFAGLILEGARREAAKATPYIMEYQTIKYPGGDVPGDTGVCTDLIIRAFRNAGVDLQKLLHEDRREHPEAYPIQIWDYKQPDPNIDHRRCQNLVVWFNRHAKSLATAMDSSSLGEWKAGDVVFYIQPKASHPWHVAIVSDKHDRDGVPFVIDSYPPRTSESHRLDEWAPIQRHFRYCPADTKNAREKRLAK